MTPADTQAAAEVADIVGSGGGLLLLGWLVATVRPVLGQWLSLMALQSRLATAQLEAMGAKPGRIPEVAAQMALDIREIRATVEAHTAA